jgi:hypothetical protein
LHALPYLGLKINLSEDDPNLPKRKPKLRDIIQVMQISKWQTVYLNPGVAEFKVL